VAEQNHWTEHGRATSVADADALGRPRRSVLSFDMKHMAHSDRWLGYAALITIAFLALLIKIDLSFLLGMSLFMFFLLGFAVYCAFRGMVIGGWKSRACAIFSFLFWICIFVGLSMRI